ncbi:GspH/FimT family pseudopilin [Kushneria sp. Sum13]|uniref:GspH/FimT family pseudopilin n=1 Tax=Kushneria sp. Sum13 TaxID=3459196 RepID=UPI0040461020
MAIQHSGSEGRKGAKTDDVKRLRQQGFTLLEMLIVVSVLAIFSLVITPSYQKVMARQELSDVSNALLVSLMYARNQASTHNHSVRICPRGSSHECGQHWQNGWQIMMADKGNNFRTIDSSNAENSDIDARLISEAYGSGSKADPILFNTMGYLSSTVSGFMIVNESDVRYVCISMSGQASVRSISCDL